MRSLRTKVALVAAAMLLLSAFAGPVGAAQRTTLSYSVTNQLSELSSANFSYFCGFDIKVYDTGRITVQTSTSKSGVLQQVTLQSLEETFVNTATGTSVTIRNNLQVSETLTVWGSDAGGTIYIYEGVFRGLNFLVVNKKGSATVSAGRGNLRLLVYYDPVTNTITDAGFGLGQETATPKLTHLSAYICPNLAA